MKRIRMHTLFAAARQDRPPRLDVAADVLARLTEARPAVSLHPYRPLVWLLTGSSALAACIAVAAVLSYRTSGDPVNLISDMISWAI